jgi:14-3-3 protein epsilon
MKSTRDHYHNNGQAPAECMAADGDATEPPNFPFPEDDDGEDHEELVFFAKMAEQAERYGEMRGAVTRLARLRMRVAASERRGEARLVMPVEERILLSVAFKNVVGADRASWRILSSVLARSGLSGDEMGRMSPAEREAIVERVLRRVTDAVLDTCRDAIELFEALAGMVEGDAMERLFFLKSAGDYHRYAAEVCDGQLREDHTNALQELMVQTEVIFDTELPPTSPIVVGMALSRAVQLYELENNPEAAVRVARRAFDR